MKQLAFELLALAPVATGLATGFEAVPAGFATAVDLAVLTVLTVVAGFAAVLGFCRIHRLSTRFCYSRCSSRLRSRFRYRLCNGFRYKRDEN